ncbi:MAG TPA: hypothetical protein VGH34_04180 [Vicinamibacterales bacterium]
MAQQAPRTPVAQQTPTAPKTRMVTPDAAPPPPPPPPAVAATLANAKRSFQAVNVQIEFTITDQREGTPPVKRTITVIAADGYTGQIRAQSDLLLRGSVPLNVDATPELLSNDGRIRLGFNLQYDWVAPPGVTRETDGGVGTIAKTSIRDSVSLILENGKPIIAAQSADPIDARKVTVEVKATILK